eukprot:5369463-Pyramimonas_sp.AAC.1
MQASGGSRGGEFSLSGEGTRRMIKRRRISCKSEEDEDLKVMRLRRITTSRRRWRRIEDDAKTGEKGDGRTVEEDVKNIHCPSPQSAWRMLDGSKSAKVEYALAKNDGDDDQAIAEWPDGMQWKIVGVKGKDLEAHGKGGDSLVAEARMRSGSRVWVTVVTKKEKTWLAMWKYMPKDENKGKTFCQVMQLTKYPTLEKAKAFMTKCLNAYVSDFKDKATLEEWKREWIKNEVPEGAPAMKRPAAATKVK